MAIKQTDRKTARRENLKTLAFVAFAMAGCGGGPEQTIQPPKGDARAIDAGVKDSSASDAKGADAKPFDAKMPADRGLKPDTSTKCAMASAGKFIGYLTAGAGQTVGGYTFNYLGMDGDLAIIDITCGSSSIADNKGFKVGSPTSLNVAADGRTIIVKPIAGNNTVLNVSINVQ